MILSSWFKFTWRKFVLIIEFLMEDSLTAINWQRTFYFLAPYLICFYGIHDWNVDINIENVKKDHRRHILDQFNFHTKENIVMLIQMYFKEKSRHFISDYRMMSFLSKYFFHGNTYNMLLSCPKDRNLAMCS